MIYSESYTEIFELLETAGRDRFDMARELVLDFDFEGHFYFFLYCPGENFRGVFLFSIPLAVLQFELGHLLIPKLMQLPETGEMAALKNLALERAESLLSGRKMDIGYFDAH